MQPYPVQRDPSLSMPGLVGVLQCDGRRKRLPGAQLAFVT